MSGNAMYAAKKVSASGEPPMGYEKSALSNKWKDEEVMG